MKKRYIEREGGERGGRVRERERCKQIHRYIDMHKLDLKDIYIVMLRLAVDK